MKWLLVLAALFAFSAHAYTGKELRDDCQAAEDAFAKSSRLDPYGSPKAARCIAYVEGFADGYAVSDFLAESVGVKLNAFCLPKSPDLTYRLVRSVLAHLERQPPNPEGSTATLVAGALSKAFPCAESLEPKK
ncbi:MAG: hypothetical protein KA535_04290 [Azonexus sp.]|nr:hypothetical protein [Azonexus sp.]